MSDKISLQQFINENAAPEFRQSLKTPQEVVATQGWLSCEEPMCCGERVAVTSMLGSPYSAECKTCGKWAQAADAPVFAGATMRFLDADFVDCGTEARWLCGQDAKPKLRTDRDGLEEIAK